MRFAIFGILLAVFCGSGCVNIGDKVALIYDAPASSEDSGGTYSFRLDGKNQGDLQSAVNQYLADNPSEAYRCIVPVFLTWERQKTNSALDLYEAFSGLLTYLSLGIWPTIMSDEIRGTLKIRNETLDMSVPVVFKKRYVQGWFSVLPVPGWAEWRGKSYDFAAGECKVLRKVLEANLRLADYRKCLIERIVRGKDPLFDEPTRRQDLILRRYALLHAPEKWRNIQQIRVESSLMQRRIRQLYTDLKTLGYDPYSKTEFAQLCERWFNLADYHRSALIELEKLYCTPEYGRPSQSSKKNDTVTLEEILQGAEKSKTVH